MRRYKYTIYEKLKKESQRLKAEINVVETKLKKYPKGKLVITKTGKYFKWYLIEGKIQSYLKKKNRNLAEKLAAKKYLTLLRDDLLHEKTAIDFYLRHHKVEKKHIELLSKESGFQELLAPFFKTTSEELFEWMNSPYEKNNLYPELLVNKCSSGNYVRSKSEAMIDTILFKNKIPFRYECALSLGEHIYYPDFTIKHPYTGKIYYWEHFGKMDDAKYRQRTFEKLQTYASHGLLPNIDLIVTFETKERPLSIDMVENVIRLYFK